MQDSDKSTVKAMKAIALLEQMKALAEEFQVDESLAVRIVEAACGGADVLKGYLRTFEGACGSAGAVSGLALSASEAQGTGCKCGEGACKAKEEIHTPAPVRKPAAPEAAPEATDLIETIESVWSEGNDEVCVGPIWVGPQNRVTIPLHIIELAEDINGALNRGGAMTVIKGEGKITVLFGDKSAEHEGSRVVHLNCNGQAQFCVSPAFTDGDAVKCLLFKDGSIAITQLSEAELLDLI